MTFFSPRWASVAVAVVLGATAVALLLPMVRRVDDYGAHTQTRNNLKQVALAVHDYHDTYRRLPDAFNTGGMYYKSPQSLWFHLLPFVESDSVYRNQEFNAVVLAFGAPSDYSSFESTGRVQFAGNIRLFAYQSIGMEAANGVHQAVELPDGELRANLTLSRIKDGTTNVIMFTTRMGDCNGVKTRYAANPRGTNLAASMGPSAGGFMGAGTHSTPAAKEGPSTATFQLFPTSKQCLPETAVFGHTFSEHGMVIAMADSSARNLSPKITPLNFARALCPGDGNELPEDWWVDE